MKVVKHLDELAPENYAKAIKVFSNICMEWNLNNSEKASLAVLAVPDEPSLVTISRVFSIYSSLHMIFVDHEQANSWIRKENTVLGQPAIQIMKSEIGLEHVQRYLSSQESSVRSHDLNT